MKSQNLTPSPMEAMVNFFSEIPQIMKSIEEIKENQQKILEHLENSNEDEFEAFVKEMKAKRILGKEKSWFSEKRKTGELRFAKVGGTVWYQKEDILQLFNKGFNKKSDLTFSLPEQLRRCS